MLPWTGNEASSLDGKDREFEEVIAAEEEEGWMGRTGTAKWWLGGMSVKSRIQSDESDQALSLLPLKILLLLHLLILQTIHSSTELSVYPMAMPFLASTRSSSDKVLPTNASDLRSQVDPTS